MLGWIVYDAEGAKRNEWFANRLRECAAALSVRAEIVTESETEGREPPDFAVVRTMNPRLNAALEEAGVAVFNNSATAKVADDKWETYVFAVKEQIPVLPTFRADARPYDVAYPVVVKSRFGHGGKEVYLVKGADEMTRFAAAHDMRDFVIQPLCSQPGTDVRLYVLGGRTVAAVKRQSRGDFRSNYSLGGEISLFTPTEGQRATAEKIAGALMSDFVGVDFILHEGEWTFNELEDPVGTRALYALTDFDAAKEYMTYAVQKVNARRAVMPV